MGDKRHEAGQQHTGGDTPPHCLPPSPLPPHLIVHCPELAQSEQYWLKSSQGEVKRLCSLHTLQLLSAGGGWRAGAEMVRCAGGEVCGLGRAAAPGGSMGGGGEAGRRRDRGF